MSVTQIDMFTRAPVAALAVAGASARPLRDYQSIAVQAIRAQLCGGLAPDSRFVPEEHRGKVVEAVRAALLVMATGGGKTRTFGEVAKLWPSWAARLGLPQRVLILAHREELITQAANAVRAETGELVEVEKAEDRAAGARIVVASMQTLTQARRLQSFPAAAFGLIVPDEAHHSVSKGWCRIFDRFPEAKILGVTATPDRADEKAMSTVYQSCAFRWEINDGVDGGYLCKPKIRQVFVDSIDVAAVRTVAGDLNQADLDAIMSTEGSLHAVAQAAIDLAGDRKTIVFSGPTVSTSQRLVEVFNRYRPGCAREVNGATHWKLREDTIADHKAGKFQFLVNVGVLTEGFDSPEVSCIVMGRMTKSRALYTQMVGRGLRIADGKEDCLIVDIVGNAGRHLLISALDVLAGKHPDERVNARAKKKLQSASMSPGDAMDAAALEIADEDKRIADEAAKKRAAVQAKVKYRVASIDPFARMGMNVDRVALASDTRLATPEQCSTLEQNGLKAPPEGWTLAQANALCDEISRRKNRGLAAPKQINMLKGLGVDATNYSRSHASALCGAIFANKNAGLGWKFGPGERERIDAIFLAPREPGSDG